MMELRRNTYKHTGNKAMDTFNTVLSERRRTERRRTARLEFHQAHRTNVYSTRWFNCTHTDIHENKNSLGCEAEIGDSPHTLHLALQDNIGK